MNYLSNGKEYALYLTDDDNFFDDLNAKVNVARVWSLKGKHVVVSKSLY